MLGKVVPTGPCFLVVLYNTDGKISSGFNYNASFKKTHLLDAAAANKSWTNVRKNSPEIVPEDLSKHLIGSLMEDNNCIEGRECACQGLGEPDEQEALDDFASSNFLYH